MKILWQALRSSLKFQLRFAPHKIFLTLITRALPTYFIWRTWNTECNNSKLCFEVASECDGTRSEHFFSRKNACTEKYNFELLGILILFQKKVKNMKFIVWGKYKIRNTIQAKLKPRRIGVSVCWYLLTYAEAKKQKRNSKRVIFSSFLQLSF